MSVDTAVICAAGRGDRLGFGIPKGLLFIGGKTLLQRQISLLDDVEDIRVVVGYKGSIVEEHIYETNEECTVIENAYYEDTNNFYGAYLATKDMDSSFIMMDADLLIWRDSFEGFLENIDEHNDLITVTRRKTDHAIPITRDEDGYITGFTNSHEAHLEWSGVCYLGNISLGDKNKYNFDGFSRYLPLPSFYLRCFEIDTQADLVRATKAYHEDLYE